MIILEGNLIKVLLGGGGGGGGQINWWGWGRSDLYISLCIMGGGSGKAVPTWGGDIDCCIICSLYRLMCLLRIHE